MDFNNFSSLMFGGFSHSVESSDICPSTEGQISNFSDGNEVNIIAAPSESSMFSSSLADLVSRQLRLSANNALYGRSLDANASRYEEKEPDDYFAQGIRNLLPVDEDDLLSGVNDWNDHIVRDSTSDDIDELDIFRSVGGLELEDADNSSSGEKNSKIINQLRLCSTSMVGENPFGEHSSRTLPVRNIHQKSPLTTSFQGFHGISSSVPIVNLDSQGELIESSSPRKLNLDTQAALAFHPHSLPEYRHGFTDDVPLNPLEVAGNINLQTQERIDNMQFWQVKSNGPFMDFDECVSKSTGNVSSSFPFSGHHEKWSNSYPSPRTMWPNSPFNGTCEAPTQQIFNQLPHFGHNFHNQRGSSFDANKRIRSRRNVGTLNLAELKWYNLDIDCIMRGEDSRTTLMIKNIPNKYTSKMLLDTINESHKGTYDFLYLPIDFKNRCNVGYAFINMINPSLIVPFYQVFNGNFF